MASQYSLGEFTRKKQKGFSLEVTGKERVSVSFSRNLVLGNQHSTIKIFRVMLTGGKLLVFRVVLPSKAVQRTKGSDQK